MNWGGMTHTGGKEYSLNSFLVQTHIDSLMWRGREKEREREKEEAHGRITAQSPDCDKKIPLLAPRLTIIVLGKMSQNLGLIRHCWGRGEGGGGRKRRKKEGRKDEGRTKKGRRKKEEKKAEKRMSRLVLKSCNGSATCSETDTPHFRKKKKERCEISKSFLLHYFTNKHRASRVMLESY